MKTLNLTHPVLAISILAAAAACGGTDDTGGGGGGGGGGGNMNMPAKLPIASIGSIQNPTESDADFSCLSMRPRPTSTAAASAFNLEIKDFEDDFHTEGLRVQVFSNNVVDLATCAAPNCVEGMTDTNGLVTGMAAAGSWFAYRVFGRAGATSAETVVGSVQFNELAPRGGGSTDGISVSAKTLDLIPNVLGFGREPGTGLIAGRLADCNDNDVYGARVTILHNGTAVEEGTKQAEPHYRYFDGDSFPSASQPYTHVDGLYAIANLPVDGNGSRELTIELRARRDGDAEPVLVARETLRIFADTVTIINVEPLRSN